MTYRPIQPPLELTRQQVHDIRDFAQAGYDWRKLGETMKLPPDELKAYVRITLPECAACFDRATSQTR